MTAAKKLPIAKLELPAGWYYVGRSERYPKGEVKTRRLFGRELVMYRTEGGRFAAADPYCPHLGAHLGHGGTVRGESIRCPFHGFEFAPDGSCVHTPYAEKCPPTARLGTWTCDERWGLCFVWFDPSGKEPWFDLPEFSMEGWPDFRLETYRLTSHPQEISENAVDVSHFTVLHGYSEVKMRDEIVFEGATMTAKYALKRSAGIFGKPGSYLESEFDARLHGLGVNHIHSEAENFGLATRILVLQTPSDNGEIELTLAITVLLREPEKMHPLVARMPRRLAHELIQRAAMWGFKKDVSEDLVMWENKAFLPRPALADGDGPIGRYRKWAKQFYAS